MIQTKTIEFEVYGKTAYIPITITVEDFIGKVKVITQIGEEQPIIREASAANSRVVKTH